MNETRKSKLGGFETRPYVILWILAAMVLMFASPASAEPFSGRVLEKGTKAPLAGASVLLEENLRTPEGRAPLSLSADADARGYFLFENVPAGEYTLSVAAEGFGKITTPGFILPSKGPGNFYLEKDGFTLPEILVSTKRLPKTAVSRQVVSKEELSKVAGTAGDVLRALQSLPGVATAGDLSGQLLVRGGGPQDNLYLLDRIPLAFPFHFGGIISTLNSDMIKNVDFSAGGFGPEFGNYWGGVIDVTQRDPRKDRWGGRADVNLLLSDLLVEGPAGKKGSLSLAGRRSYLEIMKGFFDDFTAIPRFGDYQVKYTYDHSPRTHWDFQAFGSDDKLGITIKADSDIAKRDPAFAGTFEFHNGFNSQGANLRRLMDDNDSLFWTPYHYLFFFSSSLGRDLYLNVDFEDFGNRLDWVHDFGGENKLTVGTTFEHFIVGTNALFVRPPAEGQPGFDLTSAQRVRSDTTNTSNNTSFYVEQRLRLFSKLDISLGGRHDYQSYNRNSDWSPRIAAALPVGQSTILKASWGHYRQMPWDGPQLNPDFGNPNLDSSIAHSLILGLEHQIQPGLTGRLEAYNKKLTGVVVPDPVLNYANNGEGFSRGLEVFLRRAPTERLFGWISYAYSVSKRSDPYTVDHYYDFDQRHILTWVSSYKLTRKWETGLKWRFSTGQPETPVIGAIYDPGNSRFTPVYGSLNSTRKPIYHRLDLSLSRTASYNTWQFRWYLEILNVYNSANVFGYSYNTDYTERQELKQIPFLPYFGVEAKF